MAVLLKPLAALLVYGELLSLTKTNDNVCLAEAKPMVNINRFDLVGRVGLEPTTR